MSNEASLCNRLYIRSLFSITAQDVYDKVSTHADQTQLTAPRSEYDRGVNTFSPEVSSSTVRHLSVTDASCRVDYSKVRYKRRGTTSREC